MLANVGDATSKGLEFSVSGTPVQNKNFSWTSSINFSFNTNKLDKLSNETFQTDWIETGYLSDGDLGGMNSTPLIRLVPGGKVGDFYLPVFEGFTEDGKWKDVYKRQLLCGAFFMSAQQSNQQQRPPERWKPESTEWYYPVPPKVKPGVGSGAPSDAIILFDGKDLSMWESAGKDGGPAKWTVKDGAMIVASGTGSIRTKDYFGDCQLHIEFKTPTPGKDNTLQMKGNSGIMLQSRYEVQVLDCEDNPTYVNGLSLIHI